MTLGSQLSFKNVLFPFSPPSVNGTTTPWALKIQIQASSLTPSFRFHKPSPIGFTCNIYPQSISLSSSQLFFFFSPDQGICSSCLYYSNSLWFLLLSSYHPFLPSSQRHLVKLKLVLYYQATTSEIWLLHLKQNPNSRSGQHSWWALGNLCLLCDPTLLLSLLLSVSSATLTSHLSCGRIKAACSSILWTWSDMLQICTS